MILLLHIYISLIISTSSYDICKDAYQTINFTFFKYIDSPVLIFKNEDLYYKVQNLKNIIYNREPDYFIKNILLIIDDHSVITDNDFLFPYLYEPIKYEIRDLKTIAEFLYVVNKTKEFLLHMMENYYVIPLLDLRSIFITENNVKFLLKNYLNLKDQYLKIKRYFSILTIILNTLIDNISPNINNNFFYEYNKQIEIELVKKIDELKK